MARLSPSNIGYMLVGGVVAAGLSSTAIAITEKSFRYTEEKTGYLTVNPMHLALMTTRRPSALFSILHRSRQKDA